MKTFLLLLILFLSFSCKKENIYVNNFISINNSELWLKVTGPVENLDISFTSQNIKNQERSYTVKYLSGVFTPLVKQVKDNKDGGYWTLVHLALDKSDEIVVFHNNKKYKTRGFYLGEKRFMEIVLTFNGELGVTDYDISQIEKIIYIE